MTNEEPARKTGNLVLRVTDCRERIVLVLGGNVIGFVSIAPECGPTRLVFDCDQTLGIYREKLLKGLKVIKEVSTNG